MPRSSGIWTGLINSVVESINSSTCDADVKDDALDVDVFDDVKTDDVGGSTGEDVDANDAVEVELVDVVDWVVSGDIDVVDVDDVVWLGDVVWLDNVVWLGDVVWLDDVVWLGDVSVEDDVSNVNNVVWFGDVDTGDRDEEDVVVPLVFDVVDDVVDEIGVESVVSSWPEMVVISMKK